MHERVSVHSVCFGMAPTLKELAEGWRECGTRRVSLYSAIVEQEGMAATQAALKGYQLETVTHSVLPYGQAIDAPDVDWASAQRKFNELIKATKTLGGRSMYIFTGGHGDLVWEDAAARFAKAIAPCLDVAKAEGIQILVEPAGYHYAHNHLAHSLRDLVTLAETANVGICLDVFPVWSEAGLKESIKRAGPRIGLVQVGDYIRGDNAVPGRAVPGDGHIPLKRILGWILETGYRGTFEIEIVGPRMAQEGYVSATKRSVAKVGEILRELGA